MGPIDTDSVGLVVNEAIANVIRHQYGRRAGTADSGVGRGYRRRIADIDPRLGTAVRPREAAAQRPDPSRPGGLGLVCMRSLMDEVAYTRLSDGMLLTLVKRHV